MVDTTKTVRFGILGCAEIPRKVARAIDLAPNATLCTLASRSKEKAEKFAAENGFSASVKIYGSYDRLLEDPSVDVVYVPLLISLHVRWVFMVAGRKKHVLVEKPATLDVAELDQILAAVESNDVQFMDGIMWLHHPRTAHIQQLCFVPSSTKRIGPIHSIHSTTTMPATPEFLESNIRVKPELDGLGVLGDLAWYCIGASLWAKGYQLPITVTALPDVKRNSAGVILSRTGHSSINYTVTTVNHTIVYLKILNLF
ncbi:putative oxidoreductase [Vigna angularis]|uniref:Gfo/Idh/MocA-like oxidoreductase N-terminal domain-containing protein n=2 Tax=Phaseolus angularis TaxID=3914 RepID=A0A0S3RWP2_PHAAN|nr:uncharacterized oxidoreductase At4g09670 [Vigna angularis]KAG2405453.1 putative oxidoreductase [Vigna angularis]BAT85024.1 hypothetical protein VIGAN_04251500 [Vigna angularis var. angularis]